MSVYLYIRVSNFFVFMWFLCVCECVYISVFLYSFVLFLQVSFFLFICFILFWFIWIYYITFWCLFSNGRAKEKGVALVRWGCGEYLGAAEEVELWSEYVILFFLIFSQERTKRKKKIIPQLKWIHWETKSSSDIHTCAPCTYLWNW